MSQNLNSIEGDLATGARLANNQQNREALPFATKAYNEATKLGEENIIFLSSEHLLGSIYVRLGRYSEAEPLLRKAVEGRKTVLGPENPDTLLVSGPIPRS